MKRLFCLALLLVSSISHATPDFRSSESFDLDSYRGQVVYLDFWASWCVPCRVSFPWLIETQEALGGQGLRVVTVNLDEEQEDAESFLHGMATNFPIVLDPEGRIAEQYDLLGMPSAVLIGRNGNTIQHHTGFRESDKAKLKKAIQTALEAPRKP